MIKKYGWPVLVGILVALLVTMPVNQYKEKGLKQILPIFAYELEGGLVGDFANARQQVLLPAFNYPQGSNIIAHREDSFILKKIKPVELLTMMEFENLEESTPIEPVATEVPQTVKADIPESTPEPAMEQIPEAPVEESFVTTFVPHTLQSIVNLEELTDYETLINKFYTIDNVAMIGSDVLNAEALAEVDLRISKNVEGPQILIYHTHSQEAFADSVPGDDSTTIVGVGEHLAEILRNQYGYEVLHHLGEYDIESRDNAYSRALPEVEKLLKENPSIQVVIDLHRDGVADESNKLMMDLDGRPTARFMFFNGVSCGKKTGNIDYLYNPNLTENLAFSFQMKKVAEEYYPGLTRKNYINAYRYNMHLCGRTTLIELGAQNNTVEEVMNACDPIAHILDMVLGGA